MTQKQMTQKPKSLDLEENPKPLDCNDVVWVQEGKWISKDGLVDFKADGIIFKAVNILHIKSACEFFLRYKDNPKLLIKEHPEYKKYIKEAWKWAFKEPNKNIHYSKQDILDVYRSYNEWLFKLAFKSVLEEKI